MRYTSGILKAEDLAVERAHSLGEEAVLKTVCPGYYFSIPTSGRHDFKEVAAWMGDIGGDLSGPAHQALGIDGFKRGEVTTNDLASHAHYTFQTVFLMLVSQEFLRATDA